MVNIKRILDIVFSLLAIIVLSPLLLIIGLLVLISGGRPIIYKQIRIGKNGKPFTLYKFRTMYNDADERKAELLDRNEVSFPYFKISNDPRITPIGRFLRKFSLDELPQLFNILKGEMSFVGVRPVLAEEAPFLDQNRFRLIPGLTGPAQLHRHKKLSLQEITALENDYIDNYNLLTDIKIFFKTFKIFYKGQ